MSEPSSTLDQLLATLGKLPDVRAEGTQLEHRGSVPSRLYDARIDLQVRERPVTVLVEVKKSLYPRDVRQALWQLREYTSATKLAPDREIQPMLVAEFISPGAKELLRVERVGYFDSGGSLFLPARAAYLYIDKPPPKTFERSIRTLFSGRRAQVIHALLVCDRVWFGVTEIAKEAKVAPSTASEVLTQLDRFDWLETRGQGPRKERRLREPGSLLDAWAKHQSVLRPSPVRRYYVPEFKGAALPPRVSQIFHRHQVTYALTSEAAAQLYAPFLTTVSVVRTRILAGPTVETAIADLDARVVNEGANLILLESKFAGEFLFCQQLDGIRLASPVQVYLDLLRGEARSKELAEHLRRERIKF